MSRPDDWRFNIEEMSNNGKEGKKAIYSAIAELIKNSYAMRIDYADRAEGGRYTAGGTEYIFFEFPVTHEEKEKYLEEFKKSYRHSPYGDRRDGDCREAPLLSKEDIPSTEDTLIDTNCSVMEPLVEAPIPISDKILTKFGMQGQEIRCVFDEVFRYSIAHKKDWRTTEIEAAWKVLAKYEGAINNYIKFIEGTINQFRITSKSNFNKKKETKCKTTVVPHQMTEEEQSQRSKGKSLADSMRERASQHS